MAQNLYTTNYRNIYKPDGTIITANIIENPLVLKVNSGTTEGTDLYTYNGSSTKTLDIKAGANILLAADSNSLTITASSNTYTAGNGLTLTGNSFNHADTSTLESTSNTGRTYIQNITVDEFGHITGITTGTESVVDTNTTYTADTSTGLTLTGTIFSHNTSIDTGETDTATIGSSTAIPIITYNKYGHITNVSSSTVIATDDKVLNTLDTSTKAYITGTTTATTNTGGQIFDTSVYINGSGSLYATKFYGSLNNSNILKVNSGTTEGIDLYTFNNSSSKTLDIKAGTNITLVTSENSLTINSSGGSGTYTAGAGLTLTGSEFSLTNTAVTAGTYGNNTAVTLGYSGTFKIPKYIVDAYGRITGSSDITITLPASDNTNTTYTASGEGLVLTGTVFSHKDTSNQNSVTNTGRNYIQSVTLDEFGHVTGLTSSVETVTDTTYTAGDGLVLNGTIFELENSGVTAGTYGTNSITALTNGSSFTVPNYTVDTYGRITGGNNTTLTLPTIKDLKVENISDTLASASWVTTNYATTGYYTYTYSNTNISSTDKVEIILDVERASIEQLSAYQMANIYVSTVSDGSVILRAYEVLPTVDIPVTVRLINGNVLNSYTNNLVFKVNSGTTEGTSQYTYNGSSTKTLDIKSGTGITITPAENTFTIALPTVMTNGYSHNSFYIENDIGTLFDNGTFSTQIANGTFDDIYPGCYFTKSVTIAGTAYTCTFKVVDIDPFYGGYDSYAIVNTHHVGVVITNGLPNHVMNSTSITTGGYAGSEMHTWLTGDVLTGLTTALTSTHMLAHQKLYSNAVDASLYNKFGSATGASSGWAWSTSQYISLLSEIQVYGSTICSSSVYDTGEARKQLSAFKLVNAQKIWGTKYPWLRDAASSSYFCYCNSNGGADLTGASGSHSSCPLILLK